ncbi:hypothetical protein B0F90DRAFT_634541 [Multifurca ochricompacta]|uniref:DUF6535 domain-containing protein n=1 Tax=Multifurca ochricompacta TaxID=376703 RepID=A0AAD4M2R6_9AGAM|nr:hypothetical protein B0F90DRAFT_634541 [Multifurca ochricompacta]
MQSWRLLFISTSREVYMRHSCSLTSCHADDVENGPEERIDTGRGGYPPPPAQNQASKGESTFADSSGPIFSMYLNLAKDEDEKMAERWTADADGILIFTGLFSAGVAALLAVSIQDIRPNSQDTSAFYLQSITKSFPMPAQLKHLLLSLWLVPGILSTEICSLG